MSWEKIPPVPMDRVSQFARQITHDVRNGLNAIDLQAAFLAEIAGNEEVKSETQTLRGMVRDTTKMLQVLSKKFQEPSVEIIDCPADILMESLESRMGPLFPKQKEKIAWVNEAGETAVHADVESLTDTLSELLHNAFAFASGAGSVEVRGRREGERFLLEVVESDVAAPANDPATWGQHPLETTRRGGFGLGLFKARASLAAQGGTLSHSYHATSRQLVSQVSLPVVRP